MTQVEKIKKDIQEMETALSMPSINDMPKVKERLETDLKTARAQLDSLQKKSDQERTGKIGQLPDREQQIERENKAAWYEENRVQNQATDQKQSTKAFEDIQDPAYTNEYLKFEKKYFEANPIAPKVAPKPTATIHFAGQPMPGQYMRGELWSDVRQNFKLVLLSATFRRCLSSCDYSELWSMVLFVKLWQGIHEGLKKLEGGKDYTMEELLIRHWTYGDDTKEAGRMLAEYLKQPKPKQ